MKEKVNYDVKDDDLVPIIPHTILWSEERFRSEIKVKVCRLFLAATLYDG